MTTTPTRFSAAQRFLHWTMALCILTMLFIGVGMVSVVTPKNLTLVQIHKTLGIAILVLAVLRLALRLRNGTPALPADLPPLVKLGAELSQYAFYALMVGMPLLGWGMLSAASHPVVLSSGLHLPPILPVNEQLYTVLRTAHHYLGLAFFALVLLHAGAITMLHKLIRNDGVLETMTPAFTQDDARRE